MPEYLIDFKNADGNAIDSKYFSKPSDAAALTEATSLLTAKRRSNKAITSASLYQRTLVSDRANHVGDVK